MDVENSVHDYFVSYSHELQSKMKRLDGLIGRHHWLSVGEYKESILRDLLTELLPKKFEVSTGFILASDSEGNLIKSKQQDIIIWDSSEHSAIFRDGHFVIVPPEACKAVIEVKSTLDTRVLKKALESSEELYEFVRTDYMQNLCIRKYIFAFESKLPFPQRLFKLIEHHYKSGNTKLNIDNRLRITRRTLCEKQSWRMFSIDGLFVLGQGAILREAKATSNEELSELVFNAYRSKTAESDCIYKFFEHEIHRSINTLDGNPGLYYTKQPGIFSLMRGLQVLPDKRNPTFVLSAESS
ncbi:DUF6602 domain-containing protein [Vibrio vulnificus]|uniref:DUF6602 domain-containing protein n=1 Tax=Vibrio vulnificus TaxID=672 RepID=UPI00405881D5|nr:hypothetical protein [Vibrio cholerae]